MDIYTYLKQDHKRVAKLLKQVVDSSSQRERKNFFIEIKKELELHADPERDTFYAAIQSGGEYAQDDAEHGSEEHEEIKAALKKVASAENKDQWLIYFGALKAIVEHHVEEEEGKIFSDAKKILTPKQENQLVEEMEALKQKMQESPTFINQVKKIMGMKTSKKKSR